MSGTNDKGSFAADIGQDVIAEALKSVEERSDSEPSSQEVTLEIEGPPPGTAQAAPAPEVAPHPPADSKELEQLKAQLEFSMAKGRELMEKVKDSHEKMLRAMADLENFKKRAQKEREEVQRFGVERLLKDLLPVADNLDRALEHARSSTDFEGFRQGVAMTRKVFDDALGKHGVKPFSAHGQAFDPRLHEAMQQVETSDLPPNHVVSEVLRGYTLNDRLVRPALVVVSKARATESSSPPDAPAGGDAGRTSGT